MKQATALVPGTLDVTVKGGQLTGDTPPQAVETTHELGESAAARMAERLVLTASSKARISAARCRLVVGGRPPLPSLQAPDAIDPASSTMRTGQCR